MALGRVADDAGYKAACRIKSLLEGSGIKLLIADLRMLVEPKGDVNDLWISCGFDRDKLIHELRHAPPLEISAATDSINASSITAASSSDEADAIADVVHACIVRSKSRRPYKSKHYLSMRSPLREDSAASFSIDTLTGVAYDHKLGESYAPVTLARRFQLSERTIAITRLLREKSQR